MNKNMVGISKHTPNPSQDGSYHSFHIKIGFLIL
jgi:hypothetical protein